MPSRGCIIHVQPTPSPLSSCIKFPATLLGAASSLLISASLDYFIKFPFIAPIVFTSPEELLGLNKCPVKHVELGFSGQVQLHSADNKWRALGGLRKQNFPFLIHSLGNWGGFEVKLCPELLCPMVPGSLSTAPELKHRFV